MPARSDVLLIEQGEWSRVLAGYCFYAPGPILDRLAEMPFEFITDEQARKFFDAMVKRYDEIVQAGEGAVSISIEIAETLGIRDDIYKWRDWGLEKHLPDDELIELAITNINKLVAKREEDQQKIKAFSDNENRPPEPEQPTRFVIHNAAYALSYSPEIDWVVENLFSVGSVNLVVGPFGSKKTYLIIDCGVKVATGGDWLGFKTRQVKVLFIDEESGNRRMARRLAQVLRGQFADKTPPPFDYISLAQFNLRDPKDAVLLQAQIEATGAKLIILDCLADLMPGADENSVKDVHPIFMRLRKIADATQTAIVIIHHSNKLGDYRGSTAIGGAIDLMLMVDSKPNSPFIDFETRKTRDTEPQRFSAEFHYSDDAVWLSPVAPSKRTETLSKSERYVMRFLQERGQATIDEIKASADSCSPQSARQAVYTLADKKMIRRVDNGAKGAPATYGLVKDDEPTP